MKNKLVHVNLLHQVCGGLVWSCMNDWQTAPPTHRHTHKPAWLAFRCCPCYLSPVEPPPTLKTRDEETQQTIFFSLCDSDLIGHFNVAWGVSAAPSNPLHRPVVFDVSMHHLVRLCSSSETSSTTENKKKQTFFLFVFVSFLPQQQVGDLTRVIKLSCSAL